jgi:hypothetical protein
MIDQVQKNPIIPNTRSVQLKSSNIFFICTQNCFSVSNACFAYFQLTHFVLVHLQTDTEDSAGRAREISPVRRVCQ